MLDTLMNSGEPGSADVHHARWVVLGRVLPSSYISPLHTHTYTHQELYGSTHTHFLLEEEDTVAAYEARAQTRPTILDAGMAALSSQFDRVQQVEAFHRKQAHP